MNPVAVDRRIVGATDRLLMFPHSGRPGRVVGTRELVIGRTPFIAPYAVVDETIAVLRILHGARRWPGTLTGS